ncbi:restriction endonuclease subunit S [Falsihalocynthiibacter sp. S25ZX9]|uniref:restriction endonuclease subunit S n=1 Tax=Falsihalocynthiibacter sp. S25ZX9 TaxID=3240870 RepID=UPI00351049EB
MAAYEKYPSYKDSGIEFIGDVPSDWNVEPGRQCVRENRDKNTGMKENTVLSLSYGQVIVKDEDKLTGLVPESFETYQIVKQGDIIIRGMDLQNDVTSLRTGRAKDQGIISSAYINLRPLAGIDPIFLHYLLHSYDEKKVFYSLGSGLRQNLSYLDFKYLRLPVPAPEEQRAIASFLDKKCEKIGEAVRIKEAQIALLRERRQILIQEAVTRGLNPYTPMKDSGIDWIGQIPAHWDIRRNFVLFREMKVSGSVDLPVLSVSIHSGVSSEELSDEDNIRSIIKIADRTSYKEVLKGDIAYNMMRAWQGGIGAVSVHGMVSPAYVVARPTDNFLADFFELMYRSPLFIKQMDSGSKGITDFRKRLYWDDFRDLLTILPPISEQNEIVAHVEMQSAKIETAVTLKQDQITALKEYKTSLINAAVTGKIKVI